MMVNEKITRKNAKAGLIILGGVLAVALILIGFYYIYTPESTASVPLTTPETPSDSGQTPSTPITPTTTSLPKTYQVSAQNFAFNPATLTINKGDTVIWTNMDSAPHTIISDSGDEISSNSLSTGQAYSHTFSSEGTFAYHCSVHPSMKGTVTVN